jgi:hypothetical protein
MEISGSQGRQRGIELHEESDVILPEQLFATRDQRRDVALAPQPERGGDAMKDRRCDPTDSRCAYTPLRRLFASSVQ